jgi:hypothetical protein
MTSCARARSTVSVFVLFLYVVFLAVSFWATTRIISQAGYSPAWILMPLSSLVLTIVVFIMLYVDLRSLAYAIPFGIGGTTFISGLSSVGVVWGLDMLTIFANWILFLIFAFSRWPFAADSGRGGAAPSPTPEGSQQYGRNSRGAPQPPSGSPSPTTWATHGGSHSLPGGITDAVTRDATTASAVAATSAGSVRTKHCAWCGESLPGSRALFHDCGAKDRPVTNCVACGAALPSDGAACSACAAGQ